MKSSTLKWRDSAIFSVRKSRQIAACLLVPTLMLSASAVANAETYRIGAGEKYASLQDVAARLSPGDVVELKGGATYGSVLFKRHGAPDKPITIRGISVGGRRPIVQGGRDTIEAAGNHYVFENIEITGGSFRCFFHHAHDITLRNVVVRDCPAHGILGADDDSGSMLLEQSEVFRCGDGDKRHPIYMATDERTHPGSVFRMQFCYVHDGVGGNNVKSRAERNEIYFNWIEGALYHELELIGPDGADPALKREDSDVVGNVFRKTNANHTVRIGGDGTGETNGRYRFAHNTFLVEKENRAVFRLFDGIESVEMHNNVLYAVGGGPVTVVRTVDARWSTGREVISGANNWLPKGSGPVPSGWVGTIVGADPMFEDLAAFDLRPTAGSPLRDAGAKLNEVPSAGAFVFPSPLVAVGFQPPVRGKGMRVLLRATDGKPDIGAYEGGFGFAEGEAEKPETSTATYSVAPAAPVAPARPGARLGLCGCGVPGMATSAWAWWGVTALLLVLVWRRRESCVGGCGRS